MPIIIKNNIGLIKRIGVCALIVVFLSAIFGIMFSIEQTGSEDIMAVPVFTDVLPEDTQYINTVYMNGIITDSGNGEFGKNEPMTENAAAYAAVWLYEWKNNIKLSYDRYNPESDEYIKKAEEYGIWPELEAGEGDVLTREMAAPILKFLIGEEETNFGQITEFSGIGNYTFGEDILYMYNRGITINNKLSDAYSKEKTLTKGEMAKLITQILNPDERIKQLEPDFAQLSKKLNDMMSTYDGDWSLYFEDLTSDERIVLNSHQVYSASLIKLFVIQSVYKAISDGSLADSEYIEELLSRMITYSDNNAWSTLASTLGGGSYMEGMARVTEDAKSAGFEETGQFMQGERRNFNFTSVSDCGEYLHRLINGEIVSQEYSGKILNLMKQQELIHKIPAGIPENVVTANKTGELEYLEGDAAVVFAPAGTYILVIISQDMKDAETAQSQIKNLSAEVYNFLN